MLYFCSILGRDVVGSSVLHFCAFSLSLSLYLSLINYRCSDEEHIADWTCRDGMAPPLLGVATDHTHVQRHCLWLKLNTFVIYFSIVYELNISEEARFILNMNVWKIQQITVF